MKKENVPSTPTGDQRVAHQKEAASSLLDLHFINALFAHLTGHDLYLAAQIKDAIRFSLEELEAKFENDDGAPTSAPPNNKGVCDPFYQAATRLLKTTFAAHFPQRGFYHWDAAQTLASATPLFARDEILNGLNALAPYRDSTLLITNLRPALIPPPPHRPSPKRLRDYQELIDFIRTLSAAHAPPDSQLQLLFL